MRTPATQPVWMLMMLTALAVVSACPSGKQGKSDGGGMLEPLAMVDGVVAEGTVMPAQFSTLSMPAGGILAEVPAVEGNRVRKGDVLARLETRELQARLLAARAEVMRAQATVRQLSVAPRPEELAVKQANLEGARVELESLTRDHQRVAALHARGVVTAQELERARLAVARAQASLSVLEADLALVNAGTRAEAIAVAQAGVAAARAAVAQVEAALTMMELRAPFDGTVAFVDLRPGEFVPPGAPVVRLADTAAWVVKTEDLTELAVVRVRPGQNVTLSFDALPGLSIPGRVIAIRAFGERKKGDMTYTVTVEPERQDPQLRWNMTASVRIGVAADGGVPDSGATVDATHLAR